MARSWASSYSSALVASASASSISMFGAYPFDGSSRPRRPGRATRPRAPTSVPVACPPMNERLVVIGGDAAGMGAASVVNRTCGEVEIVVFERGQHTSYAACGIPYVVAGEVDGIDDLVVRSPAEFRERGIDVRMGHEVTSIDLDARTVEALDPDGATVTTGYDQLMLGTGARPVVPGWDGVDLPHVSVAHKLPDATRLDELAAGGGRSTGGGGRWRLHRDRDVRGAARPWGPGDPPRRCAAAHGQPRSRDGGARGRAPPAPAASRCAWA